MKKYMAYGIGAALVDTEIKVLDAELAQMNVEKGLMTLVDEARRRELLDHLAGHLVKASHASGGSVGNSMIATAQFGGPTFMTCKVANDICTGDFYTLASCNPNGCGMPNVTRRKIAELIDQGKDDKAIFDALVKERGDRLTKPHLVP